MSFKLITRLIVLMVMILGVVWVQYNGDHSGWKLPWYFLHEIFLIGIPMVWLLFEALPGTTRSVKLAFILTSAIFITLSTIFELIAIENRYWWFYQELDRLTGFTLGAIPLEEFIYYPLILNIPVLFYIYLEKQFQNFGMQTGMKLNSVLTRLLYGLAALAILSAVVLLILSLEQTIPALDYSIEPGPDESGALRYSAGPKKWGWSIVQLFSTGIVLVLLIKLQQKIMPQALIILLAVFIPYAFYLELMACGRGWWVWNSQQVIGIFTWIIPIDSYLMYFTGALFPVLVYLLVRPIFEKSEQG